MGLHQKIVDRVTSEPCDCGADDDHAVNEPVADTEADPSEPTEEPVFPLLNDGDTWTDGVE